MCYSNISFILKINKPKPKSNKPNLLDMGFFFQVAQSSVLVPNNQHLKYSSMCLDFFTDKFNSLEALFQKLEFNSRLLTG